MADNIFLRTLRRIAGIFTIPEGEIISSERLDPTQLKKAYRELPFVAPVVDVTASFIFAGWFEVEAEDEEIAKICNSFYERNKEVIQQAAIESCLFGYTWLVPYWDQGKSYLRLYSPNAITIFTDPENPQLLTKALIKTQINNITYQQEITPETWTIRINQEEKKGKNPYGIIPIVSVHLNRFSDEMFGSGEISDCLYNTMREYVALRTKACKIEKRQSSLLTISGVRGFETLKPKLESATDEKTTFSGTVSGIPGIYLPDPKGSVQFVESRRGPEGIIELLKMLYHHIIVQSGIPEYLFGVGMPAAQASTKEQRAAIERKTSRLRSFWTTPLQQLNSIILRLHEVHEFRSFPDKETSIWWGPIFEKDKQAEAETIARRVTALASLYSLGLISRETIYEALPEITDPGKEIERVKKELQEQEPYPNPPIPETQPEE
ncbi:MAG: phage portal protein [candidate division WOR-3 bacterium]|nr:phage portal protein [candidate division WOR-3 bacterium]